MGGLLGATVQQHLGPGNVRATWALGTIVGVGVAFGVFRLTDRTPPLSDVAVLLSNCRLCIACGYDLESIPSDTDGCTVCPECGVAIRLMPRATPEPAIEAGAGAERS
jgi:DNA-directed RNA polymerase subunit RPC12/RpoP